jgi:hypothetical protein
VVLGDLLDEEGQFIADRLNKGTTSKRAKYVRLDVTMPTTGRTLLRLRSGSSGA